MIILLAILAAASQSVEPAPYDCENTVNQFELNECAWVDWAEADSRLNAQWKLTLASFRERSPEDAERLVSAERAWVAFRDADCFAKYPWDQGGQLDRMLFLGCMRQMSETRLEELKELAE